VGVLTPNSEGKPALPAKRVLRAFEEPDPKVLILDGSEQYNSTERDRLYYSGITVRYVPKYSTIVRPLSRRR
jgi:hypothetical protein